MNDMTKFKIFQNCHICGKSFESDYKLMKHVSQSHYSSDTNEINSNIHNSCSCGHSESSNNLVHT